MKKIEAKIVADSISSQGHRITTMLLTYPRFIHGEVMTHRMFSRNSASSRAIPFEKMVKMVEEDPFTPIAWQSKHTGMQGHEYLDGDSEQKLLINKWLEARDLAVQQAKLLDNSNVTKQLCNRLLEPFMWHTTLVTTTEISNFFELRCPKYQYSNIEPIFKSKKDYCAYYKTTDKGNFYTWAKFNNSQAEIHIQALAESMWDAMNESTPKQLSSGEWHLPFSRFIEDLPLDVKIKVSVSRAARLSYMNFDGEIDYIKDIKLHDQLLESKHFSPFEHIAKCMTTQEYYGHHLSQGNGNPFDNNGKDIYGVCNNFRGWVQYRYIVENEIK